MTPPLRRLLFCAALLSQGCISCLFPSPSPPSVCSGGFGGFGGGSAPPEEVRAAGLPTTVTLTLESSVVCSDRAAPTVTSVTVELTDPDNRPVEAVVSLPVKRSGQYGNEAWDATVTFTPPAPGAYHVIATFEPGVGLVQRDLWVANDRRGEAPAQTFALPISCLHVERTTLGSVLCESATAGAVLYRQGTEVAGWPFATARAAGNVIWVNDVSTGLSRNLDTGSGPPVQTAVTSSSFSRESFAATEDDALAFSNSRLRLVHFTGSALATDAEVQLSIFDPSALAFSRAAGSLVVADWSRWARLDLPAGQSAPTPTWTEDQSPVYQAPDGIWVGLDATTFRFVPADKNQPMATLVAPAGWQNSIDGLTSLRAGERPLLFPVTITIAADGFSENARIDKTTALVPTVRGSTIELSAFSAPPDAGFVEVTQGMLRATRGNDNLLWPLAP